MVSANNGTASSLLTCIIKLLFGGAVAHLSCHRFPVDILPAYELEIELLLLDYELQLSQKGLNNFFRESCMKLPSSVSSLEWLSRSLLTLVSCLRGIEVRMSKNNKLRVATDKELETRSVRYKTDCLIRKYDCNKQKAQASSTSTPNTASLSRDW